MVRRLEKVTESPEFFLVRNGGLSFCRCGFNRRTLLKHSLRSDSGYNNFMYFNLGYDMSPITLSREFLATSPPLRWDESGGIRIGSR